MHSYNIMIPAEKRILLHLFDCYNTNRQYYAFSALTQKGIAQEVGIDIDYMSKLINKMVSDGIVKEYFGRLKGSKRKKKYYTLTNKGKDQAQELKKELSSTQITLIRQSGTSKTMRLMDIVPYLDSENVCPDITEMDIYKAVSKDCTLDIDFIKNINKTHFIDFSGVAPEVLHFFGRKRELATIEKWLEDDKGHNIIFVHGIPGIGKTSLSAHLMDKYRGSKHIFWYNFHEMDTLRGALFKLAVFLSKLGHDHLELYLRTRMTTDYSEISRILKKCMGKIDALIVFDDFHKSNDMTRDFFAHFLRMLSSPSKTKMLILSREKVPFYDRRDVRIKKIVAELELEGLDFESCKKLLKEKGINKKMSNEVYELTAGNPLFLEFFDSRDDLDNYIHDELFLKLEENERKILGIFSIHRFPIQKESLSVYDDFDFEKLYTLRQKSIVKKDAHDRYFVHDMIKQFFLGRLSPSKRRKYHLLAARWYEDIDEPIDLIEAIYHYQEGEEHKKASQLATGSSAAILSGGYAGELLVTLERFDERNLETRVWAEILILKGKACNMVGEWRKALLYFSQSADIVTESGDDELKVKAICESGHIHEEQNQFDKAMDCFKQCTDISHEADYPIGIGMGYRGMGRVHWRKSEHELAIPNYKKCLEISKRLGELDLMASTYIDLGNVYDERYETEKAIECYNKSLDILKEVKNPYETARTYGNLAITYRHADELNKAIESHDKQLELAQNHQDIIGMGYGYSSIGYCYAKIDEFKMAKKYVGKAEDIALKIDNGNIMLDVYKTVQFCTKGSNIMITPI